MNFSKEFLPTKLAWIDNFKFLNTTGFVDFDDYEAVDLVVSQREHFIEGHRMRVELALPMVNDSLYSDRPVRCPAERSGR